MVSFKVDGTPIPKQSFRYARGHGYTPHKIKDWQEAVAWAARQAMGERQILDGELSVSLMFFLPDKKRRDLDNLSKAVLDAMNGVVYCDDQQITSLKIVKIYNAALPGVDVEVRGKDENPYATITATKGGVLRVYLDEEDNVLGFEGEGLS